MVTVCWAAKGGSGTTVVAVTLALRGAHPALLVDLDGDAPAVLGIAEPDRPGVADWLDSDAPVEHLADLAVELDASTQLLPFRLGGRRAARSAPSPPAPSPPIATPSVPAPSIDPRRLPDLLGWLRDWERSNSGHAVVDAGTGDPPEPLLGAERSLLITRNCYLAVRRASRTAHPPGGIVLIEEPGRGLTPRDIELAVGAPVVTRLTWESHVARAVDAGLLRSRLPRVIDRALRRAAA